MITHIRYMSMPHMRLDAIAHIWHLPAMPRPKRYVETTLIAFVAGTFRRIERLLGAGEDRTNFIRAAVERELRRRERKARREKGTDNEGNPLRR